MAFQDKDASSYDQASALFSISRSKGINASKMILASPDLPWYWRIRTLLLLAAAAGDWYKSEKYLLHAEFNLKKVLRLHPQGHDKFTKSNLTELQTHVEELKRLQLENAPASDKDRLTSAFGATEINDLPQLAREELEYAAERGYYDNRQVDDARGRANRQFSRFVDVTGDEGVPELQSDEDDSAEHDDSSCDGSDSEEEDKEKVDCGEEIVKANSLVPRAKVVKSYTKVPDERRILVRNNDFNDRSKAAHELQNSKAVKYRFAGLEHRMAKRLQALGREQNVAAKRMRSRGFRPKKSVRGSDRKKKSSSPVERALLETA